MKKILLFSLLTLSISCKKNRDTSFESQTVLPKSELLEKATTYFKSINSKEYEEINPNEALLGKMLYFDKRLSKKENISCNSCHDLNTFGVDNLATSPGDNGTLGARNSPTVFHASLHQMQFWDGRAKDVEEQAGGPILNPVEHNIPSEEYLVNKLKQIDFYQKWFSKVYPDSTDPITYNNITKAIGAFERKLNPQSRFDEFLDGDETVFNDQEKRGLSTFIDTGCITCHNGIAIGGQIMQKFGVYSDYWSLTQCDKIDNGLFDLTQKEADKYIFKVPGLRNVAKTAPYLHDGSIESLEKVIQIMAKAQTNIDLSAAQISDIAAFLKTLTADISDEDKKSPHEI
ncbi:cytochrome-c peroxidase [Flavobacterium sp. NKUCC04_CG]|uniref:cytochrome-c peroxidase n=1 Tax=Flavobacterium sp. NKUCC04_CG TaxID=2842121 RepID=UPI001C5B1B03|nr:cytochrome c peroxidase [Flavobacterium sp. NKUCC04_CG]MBW3519085.1 c-type cytochrome [Flavobacterium sp. NKUCC04_CG]